MLSEPSVQLVAGDPARHLELLREAAQHGPTGIDATIGAVLVLRHNEIESLARDRRVAGVGLANFDVMGIEGDLRDWYSKLLFTNEGETHSRLRRLVSRAFTPRAVEQLRAQARAFVDRAFSDLDRRGGGDLAGCVGDLGTLLMCQMLGIPDEEVALFARWADALVPVFGFMTPSQIAEAERALAEQLPYTADLVERRERDPRDDLITALLHSEHDGDVLDHDEVVRMVANMSIAAQDTTKGQIACSLITLLRHPDAVRAIRTGGVTADTALTETLRMEPSVDLIPRTLTEPLVVGGVERPAGTLIMLAVVLGNRDPSLWDDPDTFHVDRFASPNVPRPLSFGTGPHYCLGASLARMAIGETIDSFSRYNFTPAADLDEIPWQVVLSRYPERVPVGVAL